MKEIIEASMINDRGLMSSNLERHSVREDVTLWGFVKPKIKYMIFGETAPESQEEMEMEIKRLLNEGLIYVADDKVEVAFVEDVTILFFM